MTRTKTAYTVQSEYIEAKAEAEDGKEFKSNPVSSEEIFMEIYFSCFL